MFRKFTFYGLGAAILAAFACFAGWGEFKYPNGALRADVAAEPDLANEKVAFLTDYSEAAKEAEQEDKPALIFFMSKNCKYSANMLDHAFLDPQVEKLSRQFVCVQVDINEPANEDVCEDYNVDVSPTIQFVTAKGELLQRLAGEQSGDRLADQMQTALTSVAWRAARAEYRANLFR